MSRKHFAALARAISETQTHREPKLRMAKAISRVCREFNPAFNESRFLAACGLGDSTMSGQ